MSNPKLAVVIGSVRPNRFAIAVGPKAGTGGTYIPAILKVLGISAEISYGSMAAMASELLAGRADAILTLIGTPVPAVQVTEAKEPITFISLSPEQIEAIRKAMPEFSPSKIAAGTYRLLDRDYVTIGVYNFCNRASRSPGRLGVSTGQSGLREPASPFESSFGGKRNPPAECGEKYFPAVPCRCGPLLPRDRQQHSGFARSHGALIGSVARNSLSGQSGSVIFTSRATH
jgi:hypothetical protein